MANALVISQARQIAATFGMESDPRELVATLKATAFRGQVSDEQMTALLVVANQFGLNPFTKEIYAFPDKNNGIVPVVGVDGWSRIINSHPQFDGMEFKQDADSCTCVVYRKDRSHPITVTEYMDECRRGTGPWQSHPRRMLRHKAMIQCARLAFGFAGIYDPDEAERITETPVVRDMGNADVVMPTFNLGEWCVLVEDATDAATLEEVWKAGIKVAREANDRDGYEAFKNLVQARGKAIKQQATQPPVDDEFVRQMDAAEAA